MRLTLSSSAAPDAALDELVDACVRRGLAAVALCAGDAHCVFPGPDTLERRAAVTRARSAGVAIASYRTSALDQPERLRRLAADVGIPIVLDPPDCDVSSAIRVAARLRDAGVPVSVAVRGIDAVNDAADVAAAELGIAWDADPATAPVAQHADALLEDCGRWLREVRLIGGGPEAAMQEGRGVGSLMGALALARFDGDLVLTPSSPRYRVAWQTWLGRRGWGCGSSAEAHVLPLAGAAPAAGGG